METNLTLKEENSQEYLSLQKQLSEYSKLDNRSKFHLSLEIEKLFENNIDKGLHLLEMNLFTFYSNSKLRNVIQLIVEEIKDTEQIMRIMYDKLQSVLQNYESLSKDEKDSITFLFEELIKLSPLNAIKIIDQYQELFYSVNSLEEIKMKNLDFIIENAPPLQKDTSMNLLEKIDNSIEVYEKPSDILSDDEKKIAKNILIIGETGVGKSSFINSFVCYLLGVQMYNKERFKMVNEKVETQTQSVTSDIISYTIRPKENICKCPIRLIDTPGFGDTRGEKVENSNIEKLSDYLKKEITEIHAIIFVFKSSTNRIHSFQTEIFNKMMNLFGKDAANNFTVLFTFRDVGEPEALAAVNKANLTFKEKFECNNSVFFSSINKDRKIIQEFWKLSIENYRKIISFIMTTFPTQIGMTKTMLKLKKKLVLIIEHLKTSTNELLERLVGFQKERNRLIENKKKLLEQPNFIEEVYYVSKKVPTLNWNLTCSECKKTCHKNCEAVNMFLWGCESFSWGYCITCNHSWRQHYNDKYIFERVKSIKKIPLDNLTKNNLEESSKCIDHAIDVLENELIEKEQILFGMINKIKFCEDYLKEISFRFQEVDLREYFNTLIENESNKKDEGYELKIQLLNDMLNKIDDYKNLPEAPKVIEALIDNEEQPNNEMEKKPLVKRIVDFLFG